MPPSIIKTKGYQSIRAVKEYPLIGEYPLNVRHTEGNIPDIFLGNKNYKKSIPCTKKFKEIVLVKELSEIDPFKETLRPLFNSQIQYEGKATDDWTLVMPKVKSETNLKEVFKESSKLFGSKIEKRINAASWTSSYFCWPKEVQYILDHPRRKKLPILNTHALQKVFEDEDKITELYYDGLTHLAPVTLFLNKTPKEMKEILGKGLWSDLSNQSPYKIRLIGWALSDRLDIVNSEAERKALKDAINVRAGLVRHLCSYGNEFKPNNLTLIAAKLAPRVKDWDNTYQLVIDTNRLLDRLGGTVRIEKWSLKRFKEEHDNLTKQSNEQALKKLTKDGKLNVEFAKPLVLEFDGFTFNRLTTEAMIKLEGIERSHCVGSYSQDCKQRSYEVFTVTSPNERATLGLRTKRVSVLNPFQASYTLSASSSWTKDVPPTTYDDKYEFNQCYQKYNRKVSSELSIAVGKLIDELNSNPNLTT